MSDFDSETIRTKNSFYVPWSKRSVRSLALSEISGVTLTEPPLPNARIHIPYSSNDPEKSFFHDQTSVAPASWSLNAHLMEEVDHTKCDIPLAIITFVTGWMDAITFSSIFVWCAFQTGNYTQLAVAIARLFEGPPSKRDPAFHVADQQALTALLSFNAGIILSRLGDRVGATKRCWLLASTFVQCLFMMGAAILLWKSGEKSIPDAWSEGPIWNSYMAFTAVGLMSMSLGMQGVMAKRINTQFGTALVLTTVMVETFSDPSIIQRSNPGRTQRLCALLSLFLGGFGCRAVLPYLDAAGCLGLVTGIKLLVAISWLLVPSKVRSAAPNSK